MTCLRKLLIVILKLLHFISLEMWDKKKIIRLKICENDGNSIIELLLWTKEKEEIEEIWTIHHFHKLLQIYYDALSYNQSLHRHYPREEVLRYSHVFWVTYSVFLTICFERQSEPSLHTQCYHMPDIINLAVRGCIARVTVVCLCVCYPGKWL